MSQQEFLQPRRNRQEQELTDAPEVAVNKASFNIDALLEDIDTILEKNAETFVQGFVQKGGQ